MVVRKPGPGSSQAEVSAYIKQEIAKKMEQMKTVSKAGKTDAMKKTIKKAAPAKSARGGAKKTSKPAPKLY